MCGVSSRVRLDARVLWLSVPDAAIRTTAEWLVAQRADLRGQVVVHSSGALDRSVLCGCRKRGRADRFGASHDELPDAAHRSAEGNPLRCGSGRCRGCGRSCLRLVKSLGGKPFAIDSQGKAMYHAGAMFGSPLLVATLAAGVRVLEHAGVAEKEALALLGPMALATVANVQKQGLARSFSGPLARGDAATIKLHRKALAGHPLEAQVYDSLARLAAKDLPSADRPAIEACAGRDVSVENQGRRSKRL